MPSILDPLTVRGLTLRNRFVLAPMRSRKAALDGFVTDEIVHHYAELSAGAGVAVVEHAYVVDWGRVSPQLGVSDDTFIPGLARLAEAIHTGGAVAILQMSHAGSHSSSRVLGGQQPVAPSAVRNPRAGKDGEVPREITKAEMDELTAAFGAATMRAVEARFDGVEVHCAHGFLLSEFLSPITNRRLDDYGGSVENRARFPVEVIGAIRRVLNRDVPVFCRFPGSDLLPGGLELAESVEMGRSLVDAGVDILDVSGGIGGIEPPPGAGPRVQGYLVPLAEAVKKATGAMVIGVGGVVDPWFADSLVREGRVDLVAVGRATLSNPDWFRRAIDTLRGGSSSGGTS
jgi:NADPH2 dehydrogenase